MTVEAEGKKRHLIKSDAANFYLPSPNFTGYSTYVKA
jgi:hypothetical protein